jgi:hypothetical protein
MAARGNTLLIVSNHLNRRRRRQLELVQRTHEADQTSRRGLKGSDGSWWALLPVRQEARRGSRQIGKHPNGASWRCKDRWQSAHQRGDGTEGRADTARIVWPGRHIAVRGCRAVLMRRMLMDTANRRAVVEACGRSLHCPKLALRADPCRRTQHCCSQSGLDREQGCQEHQQPGAGRLHLFRLAQDVFRHGRQGCKGTHTRA